MTNFIYGNVVLADNKSDGGAVTSTAKVVASEWNTSVDALYDTKAAITASQYVGFANMVGNLPSVAAANTVRWTSASGQVLLSRSGEAFWNPLTTVNLLSYGADPTFATDSTAAIQAAVTYCAANGKLLFCPSGTYKVTATITATGGAGFGIVGEGRESTIFKWRGPGGGTDDMFQFIGCQLWSLRYFACRADSVANGGTRPKAMIHSLVNGSGLAAYGMTFEDILCDGSGAADLFDYGFLFSTTGTGNNSEVTYTKCEVNKAKIACYQIEGTQAKGHNFYECTATTSPYGVIAADGGFGSTTYNWRGGSMAHLAVAFKFHDPGEPITIEQVDCEEPDRFIDIGFSSPAGQPLTVRGCRVDATANPGTALYSSMILIGTGGPTLIDGNIFQSGASNIQFKFINQSAGGHHAIDGNQFSSDDSWLASPVNWDTGNTGPASSVFIGRNCANVYYIGAAGVQTANRMEGLDWTIPEITIAGNVNNSGSNYNSYVVRVGISAFIAAALTQTVSFTLPQGVRIQGWSWYQNGKLINSLGASTTTVKVGSTSGGDEYILDTDVSAANSVFLNDPANLGLKFSSMPPGGYVPNYFSGSTYYITLTSSSGNLGTGAATHLSGDLFFVLTADIAPRWLRVS